MHSSLSGPLPAIYSDTPYINHQSWQPSRLLAHCVRYLVSSRAVRRISKGEKPCLGAFFFAGSVIHVFTREINRDTEGRATCTVYH